MRAVDADPGARVAARYGLARSAQWPAVERAHRAKHPLCVACLRPGARNAVHHIFPFHFCVLLGRPDLELDERNLVTLCAPAEARGAGDHHLLIGHYDDYESMNAHAKSEAEREFHGMTAVQIRANAAWKKLAAGRPPHFDAMTEEARRNLRQAMDDLMPK